MKVIAFVSIAVVLAGALFAVPARADPIAAVPGPPATINLTATPSTLACDGRSSSNVAAVVLDADSNPVADGTPITFNVVALGVAQPLFTTTSNGAAKTQVTPLAAGESHITVTVVAGTAASRIDLDCAVPTETPTTSPTETATPSPTETASPTAAATSTATGTATATKTPAKVRCMSDGERFSLILRIGRRLGDRAGERGYRNRLDMNHDGVIRLDDALAVLFAPECSR